MPILFSDGPFLTFQTSDFSRKSVVNMFASVAVNIPVLLHSHSAAGRRGAGGPTPPSLHPAISPAIHRCVLHPVHFRQLERQESGTHLAARAIITRSMPLASRRRSSRCGPMVVHAARGSPRAQLHETRAETRTDLVQLEAERSTSVVSFMPICRSGAGRDHTPVHRSDAALLCRESTHGARALPGVRSAGWLRCATE